MTLLTLAMRPLPLEGYITVATVAKANQSGRPARSCHDSFIVTTMFVRRPVTTRVLVVSLTIALDAAAVPPPGHAAAAAGAARPAAASTPIAQLSRAVDSFRAGDYEAASRSLQGLPAKLPRVRDHVLYLAGESEFFAGHPKEALAHFRELERNKTARLFSLAPYRVADCLWSMGDRAAAVAAYRKLLGPSAEGERPSPKLDRVRFNAQIASGWLPPDPVVGRFRIALFLADSTGKDGRPDARAQARAAHAFRSLHVEFPAHPLADEAARRAGLLEPAPPPAPAGTTTSTASETPVRPPSGPQALARAAALSDQRRFEDAVAELERLPANQPAPIEAERKYLLGMTKYKMRNDYPRAAQLLLAAAEGLTGDKAAQAAFHGTRALSRADRDDEAIAGYRRFVDKYPSSKLAPEASFLAGWLDFNRGRFRQALPSFDATIQRFARSSFAVDAAWFTALGHFLLAEPDAALTALDRYAKLAGGGEAGEAARRIAYFRARALWATGKQGEARTTLQELAGKAPFSYYGIMAQSRLRAMGSPFTPSLPTWSGHAVEVPTVDDPLIARVDELAAAGLTSEAGAELQRGESALLARRGKERGLALLFDRYPRFGSWRRAFQLADVHGDAALASAPQGPARLYWVASFPRAYADLVDKYGPPAGNPDLFVHSIMRKESAYLPTDVSYADARGLMQTLPSLAARLAADSGAAFADDQLYVPEVSIRWGAKYTGALARKFRGNVLLAAGGYNAGAGAVMRWCDQNGKRPLDEFIELVTYDQTRKYMKLVLEIYARYHLLYKGAPFEPVLTDGAGVPGCRFDPTVPDFIEKVPAAPPEGS
jgi:TolA-binding protein